MAGAVVCTLFLLVVVPNTFGASLLRRLNDEVSKINELIEDINEARDSQRVRELRRDSLPANYDYEPSMKRAVAALTQAAKLQKEMQSLLKKSTHELKDDSKEEPKAGLTEVAQRALISAEKHVTDSEKKDAASDLQEAIKLEDKVQGKVRKHQALEAEDATMKPPEFIGPTLSSQQLFNNLVYEALANTMQKTIKKDPILQKELGTDWDPVTLMKHKPATH